MVIPDTRQKAGAANILFEKCRFFVRVLILTTSTFFSFPAIFRSSAKLNSRVIMLFLTTCKTYFNKSFYEDRIQTWFKKMCCFITVENVRKKVPLVGFPFEAYSEPSQTTRVELFEIIVNI